MYARCPSVLLPHPMDRPTDPADAPPPLPETPPRAAAPPGPGGPKVVVLPDLPGGPPDVVVAPAPGPTPPRATPRAAAPSSTLPAPIREPSPTLAAPPGAPVVAPESRMLPPHQTKTERVADHVAAISADLRDWVELRIALVKRQVEGIVGILERVQHLAEAAKLALPGAVLVVLGLLFLLLTLAFAIGALIDSVWGGFAIVTGLLLVAGGVLLWFAKKRYDEAEEAVAEAKRQQRAERTVTRQDVETAERRKATLSAS